MKKKIFVDNHEGNLFISGQMRLLHNLLQSTNYNSLKYILLKAKH